MQNGPLTNELPTKSGHFRQLCSSPRTVSNLGPLEQILLETNMENQHMTYLK